MKLGLHGWQMGRERDLETMLGLCAEAGLYSFEIMIREDFQSRVDLDASPARRTEVRRLFERSGVKLAGLSHCCRYDALDPAEVKQNVEATKGYATLAADLGAPRLRCLGDRLHEDEGEPKARTIERVAASLREVCVFADPLGIDCGLEMHGHFSPWEIALATVAQVGHPRCHLIHNGQPVNTPPERWDEVWTKLRPWIRHAHVHDILNLAFPHRRFFRQLRDDGYAGIVSLEQQPSADPVRVLRLTKALVDTWLAE
ncbi:MAG: sugar phosphate isomerase/epimerase [Planctomycetota bacterium]|nr:sugar phosphate isomerase/epimerase [Planctomycetota bacterium]